MSPLALFPLAFALPPDALLVDAGEALPERRVALVLVTPGVPVAAYGVWIEAIEDANLDAWTLSFAPGEQGFDAVRSAVAEAFSAISTERPGIVVLAHGYAGVFALTAGLQPERMVLVGTPLAAQLTPVRTQPASGATASALPWDPAILGGLPAEPYSGELSRSYATWAQTFPSYTAPACPTLLVASTLDPVAPPEVVRLPSQSWPVRTWLRPGPLHFDTHDPTTAELLSDPVIAKEIAKFAAEGAP